MHGVLIFLSMCLGFLCFELLADEPDRRLRVSNGCVNCHGFDGVREGGFIPSIAGLPQQYLLSVFSGYRDGSLRGSIMNRVMEKFSDSELEQLATGFSSINVRPRLKKKAVQNGRQLYEQHCANCHQPSSKAVPGVMGQNVEFMRAVLADMKQGNRMMSTDMKSALSTLTPSELNKVLNYLDQWMLEVEP